MEYLKKNKGSLISGAIFAFVPAVISLYSIELKNALDSFMPNLFFVILGILIIFLFYVGYKLYSIISKSQIKINELKIELKQSNMKIQKQNTLINQLEKLNIASVKKVFNEFERAECEKSYLLDMCFTAKIVPEKGSPLYDVIYTWEFDGKALKNVRNAHFTREISSDGYIDIDSLNLSVERIINKGNPKKLENASNGYNLLHKQGLDDTKGLDIFLADSLMKGDSFKVVINYTIKTIYKKTGDRFLVFPFTFDDANCNDLVMIVKSDEQVCRGAKLFYINSETDTIERKTLESFEKEYRLTFTQNCCDKFSGYFEIITFVD